MTTFSQPPREGYYVEDDCWNSSLTVNTSSEVVEFCASDERDDAWVSLKRSEVERLHAQLGAWLANDPPSNGEAL